MFQSVYAVLRNSLSIANLEESAVINTSVCSPITDVVDLIPNCSFFASFKYQFAMDALVILCTIFMGIEHLLTVAWQGTFWHGSYLFWWLRLFNLPNWCYLWFHPASSPLPPTWGDGGDWWKFRHAITAHVIV